MTTRHLRLWLLLVIVCTALACGDDPASQSGRPCTATRDCPGGQFCGCGGICITPAPCEGDGDCCANEVCTSGLCLNLGACETAADCASGQDCSACACVPRSCESAAQCEADELCESGLCLPNDEAPCFGECELNELCSLIDDACLPRPSSCEGVVCQPGETLIVAGLDAYLGPACSLEPQCACASARAVPDGDIGTEFSAVSLDVGRFLVVAHDHFYGDLAALELTGSEPAGTAVYIDGIPDAQPRGDPDGLRGGVLEPGPDRGGSPSLALLGGLPGVSYRDEAADTLRFAHRDATGTWEASVVDASADAGRYSSLAALGDRWVIAYFADTGVATQLRVAASLGSTPFGPGDWVTTLADEAPVDPEAPDSVLPSGVGLSPSILAQDGEIWVAYYASSVGELRLAAGPAGGPFDVTALDTGGTESGIEGAADAGLYASLVAQSGGRAAVAFLDRISGRITYAQLARNAESGAIEVDGELEEVDPGRRMSPPTRVGADLRLVIDTSGRSLAVYQDSTEGDLWLAVRGAGEWSRTPVARTDVAGFSPHLFPNPNETWVLHGVLRRDENDELVEAISARTVPDL